MGYYSKNFYARSYRPEGKWLSIKDERRYYQLLTDMAFSLQCIFPDLELKNRYERLEHRYLSKMASSAQEYYWLYQLLLRGITKLHYRNRVIEGQMISVAKEDVLLTLSLLQPLVWPRTLIGTKTKAIYQELIVGFYPNDFSVYEGVRKLRVSKSTLNRHIVILVKCEYLERVGGNKKQGYRYNVGRRSI